MKVYRREVLRLMGVAAGSLAAAPLLTACEGAEADQCGPDFWRCGNHVPVAESDAFDLQVEGALPVSLRGLYVRNGPNPLSGRSPHWFAGDGMMHGVRLRDGAAAWYRARYVKTGILGRTPPNGPPGLTQHNGNTNVIGHAGRVYALAEAGLPFEVSRDDLSTIGAYDFGGRLTTPMTAHPKIDPRTGELLFFGAGVSTPTAHFHVVDGGGSLVRTEQISLPAPVLMHDFQITESYALFMDLPLVFDLQLAIATGGMGYRWTPSNGARIGVMPREGRGDAIQWIEIEPCFVFHTVNAHQDSSNPKRIFLDVVRYPQMWVNGPSDFDQPNDLSRYTIDLAAGSASREVLYDKKIEFPRIDPRRQGVRNRYAYSILAPGASMDAAQSIAKFDLQTGATVTHRLSGGLLVGEPTFVPDTPGAGEDEGWLLFYAYEPSSDRSRLIVFDATDITSGPVAGVRLPTRVPYGFHGNFIPDQN